MAIIKKSELSKMSNKERLEKLNDLKLQLVKGNVIANRSNSKSREIKRTIARIITLNKIQGRKQQKS